MVANGTLIVLISATSSVPLSDDLSRMRLDKSLSNHFNLIIQTTSAETAAQRAKDSQEYDTIIAIEKGYFETAREKAGYKNSLEQLGIPLEHILFGEDYSSGCDHMVLRIHELCG